MERDNYYFKVPFNISKDGKENAKQVDSNLHIVGIIDASGSMSSWWSWIAEFYNTAVPSEDLHTITFDGKVRQCPENKLSTSIYQHGGGLTSIPEVFMEFENHLKTVPSYKNITVLFISDGQDNNLHSLQARMSKLKGNTYNRNINFICLGIKSGFPTFLSMQLRNLYHRGDAIPALYLVEYASEKAFFNKFEGIKKYFYSSSTVKLDPPVSQFPWDETVVDQAYEGSWIITQAQEISINNNKYQVYEQGKQQILNVEEVVDLFRGWVQQLQLTSLTDMKSATQYANIAYQEMEYLIQQVNQTMGLNVLMKLEDQNTQKGDSLCLRAKKNYIIRYGSKLQWFLDEVKQLTLGKSTKQESEFEAAKRMNIGTITGKYQQKVLSLKNITAKKFQSMIQDFLKVYKTIKLQNTDNLSSVKKILLEKDFEEGLQKYITNQYDFTEMFEIEGVGFKLKRSEKTQDNVYECEGRSSTNFLIDLPTLIQKDFLIESQGINSLLFAQIERQHQDGKLFKEELNCLVPLFSKQGDADLADLLNTDLMKFLMSFIVTLNADIMFEDAYEILIGQFLTVILHSFNNEPLKKEQQEYLQKCYESLDVFYRKNKSFQQRKTLMLNDPVSYFQKYSTEHHLIKNFVMVFYTINNNKDLSKPNVEKLLELFQINFFSILLQQNGGSINNIIKPEITENIKKSIIEFFKENIQEQFSWSLTKKELINQVLVKLEKSKSEVAIPKKLLYNNEQNPIPLIVIENFIKLTTDKEIQQNKYTAIVKHISINNDCYNKEIDLDISKILDTILQSLNQENIIFIPGFSVLCNDLEKLYSKYFSNVHQNIKPLRKEEIQKLCLQKGVNYNLLEFSVSGLLKNACMSPKCKYFLDPNPQFDKHLAGWKGNMPYGFHRFVSERIYLQPQRVLEQAKKKWGKNFPNNYDVNEDFALKYIEDTITAYQVNKFQPSQIQIQNQGNKNYKYNNNNRQQNYENHYANAHLKNYNYYFGQND